MKKAILLGVTIIAAMAIGGYATIIGFLMGSNFDTVKMVELENPENYVIEDCNYYGVFASYTSKHYVGPSDAEILLETFVLVNDMIFTN